MNRRSFLRGVGATALAGLGYGGLRVTDIRPYDPPKPTGETPRERILAAARSRHAVDHRAITRVQVLDDWTGETPYDLDVRKQWHEHSRRRHLHTLTTFDRPLTRSAEVAESPGREFTSPYQDLWALFHYNRVYTGAYELPLTNARYVTDGSILYDFDAETTKSGRVRIADNTEDEASISRESGEIALSTANTHPMRGEFIRPHRTDWTHVADTETTSTFQVIGVDAYAQVVPLSFGPSFAALDDCWLEVTLDTETGNLRRIVDTRAFAVNLWKDQPPRELTYRLETEFDQYGTATANPVTAVDRDSKSRLASLVFDLQTY